MWVWPWQRVYCRDFLGCIEREWVLSVEGDIWHPMDPPTREELPVDRATETAPEDVEKCSVCNGSGEYLTGRQDWHSGAYEVVRCAWCDTTGYEPTYLPPGTRLPAFAPGVYGWQ